jgi:L1 cell adhesion molecule like protein
LFHVFLLLLLLLLLPSVLIGGSTRVPRIQALLSEFFHGKQLCKRINPDEAVAYGAAVLGANLSLSITEKIGSKLAGEEEHTQVFIHHLFFFPLPHLFAGLTLMDVTALSLGIELVGGKMSVIIPRNTCIPYSHTRTYYNNEDQQTEAHIQVFEGENLYTKENRLLGDFELKNMPQVSFVSQSCCCCCCC